MPTLHDHHKYIVTNLIFVTQGLPASAANRTAICHLADGVASLRGRTPLQEVRSCARAAHVLHGRRHDHTETGDAYRGPSPRATEPIRVVDYKPDASADGAEGAGIGLMGMLGGRTTAQAGGGIC